MDSKDPDKIAAQYEVIGVYGYVKKYFHAANDMENALLMEFVLHGLASNSVISKKTIDGSVSFTDLMGSMIDMNNMNFGDDDLTEDDFN